MISGNKPPPSGNDISNGASIEHNKSLTTPPPKKYKTSSGLKLGVDNNKESMHK
jgi:hypothetical protein